MPRRVHRPAVLLGCVLAATFASSCIGRGDPSARGERAMTRADFAAAVSAYGRAIEAAGDDHTRAIAYANRCIAHDAMGLHQEAVDDCTRSLELEPDNPEVLNNRAVAYLNLRQRDDAIDDLNAAIGLRDDYPEALANLGRAHVDLEDYDEAIDFLTRALEVNPELAEAFGNRAVAYESLGDDENARCDYARAIARGDDPQAYFNRAMLHYTLGYFDDAFDDFGQVMKYADPNSIIYYQASQQREFLENRPEGFDPRAGSDEPEPPPCDIDGIAPLGESPADGDGEGGPDDEGTDAADPDADGAKGEDAAEPTESGDAGDEG